ncbi:MAG TPA: glycosyltransferase family 39 protein [Terriglobales bacterium]
MSKQSSGVIDQDRPWWTRQLTLMIVAAFVMRLLFMLAGRTYIFSDIHNHFGFGFETGSIAGAIARGEGFSSPFGEPTGPTAWSGPIYPYLLAGLFQVFGLFSNTSAIVILAVNSLFAALTCWPIYRIGSYVFGRRVGLLAGWMWALVPFFYRWAITWVWDPPVSAFLLGWGALIALEIEDASWKRWLGFGALGGIAALVNPALSTLFPLLILWAVWKLRKQINALPQAIGALAIMAVLISPWLIRNRIVLGEWVYLRDNAGFEFSLGNFAGSPGVPWSGAHPAVNRRVFEQYKEMGELAFIEKKHQNAMNWVHQHPGDFLMLSLKRVKDFWDGSELNYEPLTDPWRPWMVMLESAPALLGLLIACVRRVRLLGPIALVLLVYPLPYYIVYTNPRYRHAIEPFLVILISYFVFAAWDRFGAKHRTEKQEAVVAA